MIRVIAVTSLWLFFIQVAIAQEVTPIEKLAPGMSATIQGKVTRILDEDEFRIQDATGNVRLGSNRLAEQDGDTNR